MAVLSEKLGRNQPTLPGKNITPILMTVPLLLHLDDYPFAYIHKKINDAGRAYGYEIIDLLEVFQKYPGSIRDLRVSSGDHHPSSQGHQLIADSLYQKIKELRH